MASERRGLSRRLAPVMGALALTAAPLGAQAVALRIRPKPGDTLHTRFEQQVEMRGATKLKNVDTSMTVKSTLLLLSHFIVEASDESGTTVAAVTDSVAYTSAGGAPVEYADAIRRALQGRRLRLRFSAQGAASVIEGPNELSPDLQSLLSQMPATLPKEPVAVGGSWSQVMQIPVAGQAGAGAASVHASYRLDSLSNGGSFAHITMRGTITRDSAAAELPRGIKMISAGSISGTLLVDRKRGWWTDARATIVLKSTVIPRTAPSAHPLHFQTRITQRMRTVP